MASATTATRWTGRHYVDGQWKESDAGFENRDPARFDDVLGVYPSGTAHDVDQAVRSARKAFVPWRRESRIRRGDLFARLAELIRRETDELALVLSRESGKLLNEARAEVVEG